MNIRPAAAADAAVIADFNIRLASESEGLALPPETIRRGVEALLADRSKGIYYVAEVRGEIVGQLMITCEWSDWRNGMIWWIQSVYVKPEFRGQGIFKALFEHVERLAREGHQACALRLYMDKHNDQARRAYEKLGMNETNYLIFEFDLSGGHK